MTVQKEKTQASVYGLNLIFDPENLMLENHQPKISIADRLTETTAQKFDRLMKESEESLKSSKKII